MMRVLMMATGEIAEPAFAALLASGYEVLGLVTQPDRPFGRKQELRAPGVKCQALAAGVPVWQPEAVKEKGFLEEIRDLAPEVIVVMAYGQLLPQALIDIPSRAIINLHASLLPKYRGASCIQSALLAGDDETGWTVMHVVQKLDAGDMILQHPLKIAAGETGGSLHDRLASAAPSALLEGLDLLASGRAQRVPQDENLTSYAPKLGRDDGVIDWSRPAAEIARLIQAYDPWPGTATQLEEGGKSRRLKVFAPVTVRAGAGEAGEVLRADEEGLEVACGEGSVLLREVQVEGKRRMSAHELTRGRPEILSARLK
ncbi:MAG: methionyl-tRNA formyltransferase [Verrucomicrobiales bacterium]